MKSKLFVIGIITLSVIVASAATLIPHNQVDFLEQRAALLVREIGHKLLLQSGDSRSRVLPVTQLSKSVFQLKFQNKFAFMPDSLVKIVQNELQSTNLPLEYMVTVFDCTNHEIIYGFEIRPKGKDIVPCLGREQPRGCYYIQIAFMDIPGKSSAANFYPIAIISLLCSGLVALVITGFRNRPKPTTSLPSSDHAIAIGKYQFEFERKTLTLDTEIIALSEKEAQLLTLFATHQNQLIDRDRLLKEVWENDGVFTGRSLDMFVSRLRKKLVKDVSIRLVNIHGRGYKLEIL